MVDDVAVKVICIGSNKPRNLKDDWADFVEVIVTYFVTERGAQVLVLLDIPFEDLERIAERLRELKFWCHRVCKGVNGYGSNLIAWDSMAFTTIALEHEQFPHPAYTAESPDYRSIYFASVFLKHIVSQRCINVVAVDFTPSAALRDYMENHYQNTAKPFIFVGRMSPQEEENDLTGPDALAAFAPTGQRLSVSVTLPPEVIPAEPDHFLALSLTVTLLDAPAPCPYAPAAAAATLQNDCVPTNRLDHRNLIPVRIPFAKAGNWN